MYNVSLSLYRSEHKPPHGKFAYIFKFESNSLCRSLTLIHKNKHCRSNLALGIFSGKEN